MSSSRIISPPRWANRFLEWYCDEDLLDEIQGDLIEQFHKNHDRKGLSIARWKFTIDVIRFFRPSSIKKTQINMNIHIITNYLKVALRVFKKERGYTASNILGLALGITCSLFIYLWVQDELEYNSWPEELDKIHYVLVKQQESSGTIHTWTTTPYPLQPVLQEKYPAIEKAAMINWGTTLVTKKGEEYLTLSGHYGTPEIFEVFSIPFVQGSHQLLYDEPQSVVLSESAADRYFGESWREQNVIGTSITNKDNQSFKLAGIFKDLPRHSTLRFDLIIPFVYMLKHQQWQKHWGNYNHSMYVKIADGYTSGTAQENVVNAIAENRPDDSDSAPLILQPLSERYLYTKFENGIKAGGRIDYVRLLSISAILILLLASVNFVNLTTARSSKRSKETGIRKVMGAQKRSLRIQFVLEAILITIAAFVLSAVAVGLLLPTFNTLANKSIGFEFFTLQFVITCIGFIVGLGILSGLYPAVYMASLNPILSIKGIVKADRSNALFRKSLVVFQFAITITMIIGSVTIFNQLQYVLNKNLGLDKQNVMRMSTHDLSREQVATLSSRLINMPGIAQVTTANQDPTNVTNSTSDPSWEGKDPRMDAYFHVLGVDPNFLSMMDVKIKSGRDFDPDIASDSTNFLINEVTAELMGLSDPVGTKLEFWGTTGRVIGVVKNFHIASLHAPIQPLILAIDPYPSMFLIKTKPGETQSAIASVEQLHTEYMPEEAFEFSFLDVDYENRYRSELLVSKLTLYFTIVAIIISCLGLLSLISFNTELKTKEIGIRKVLGASVGSILSLIGKEFLLLILIAFVLAAPLAAYIMNTWLDQFAYSIQLDVWLFVIAGASALLITLLTIANHTIRSAIKNPADSLRTE